MGIYDDALPDLKDGDAMNHTVGDHTFKITTTDKDGINTGRRRYRVECTTCAVEVHPATTGPMQMADMHTRGV